MYNMRHVSLWVFMQKNILYECMNVTCFADITCYIYIFIFICSNVFHLDYSSAPSSVVSRLTRNLIRSSSLLSEHSEEVELPTPVQQWLDQYSSWCNDWKIKSLDVLLARCVTTSVNILYNSLLC